MGFEIRSMHIEDYEQVLALWQRSQGIGLSSADERDSIQSFLRHNPSLCFVAQDGDLIIGTVLCGFDGRRGYLYHLAVDEAFRRQGIGNALMQRSLDELHKIGGQKCHLLVYFENENAQRFYKQTGWVLRTDILVMSKDLGCGSEPGSC